MGRNTLALRRLRPLGFLAAVVGVPLACSGKTKDPAVTSLGPGTGGTGGTGATAGSSGAPPVAASGGLGANAGSGTMIDVDASVGGIDNMGLNEGGAGGEKSCAGEQHPAELVPIDMYVMLDRSLSMNAKTSAGITKWKAVTDALAAFVSDPGSEGIGVGIQYFPANPPCTDDEDCGGELCYKKACRNSRSNSSNLPGLIPCVRETDCPGTGDTCEDLGGCGDQSCISVGSMCDNDITCEKVTEGVCASQTVCTLSDYAEPEVPIAALPGAKDKLVKSLAAYSPAQNPFGLTPTGPALEGAISYARGWAEDHPTRRSIVVLATDGAPTGGCTPARRSEIAALASVGAGAAVPVRTFTIGVFAPVDPNDPNDDSSEGPDNIRAIAEAGDGQAFVISDQEDVAAQFVEALNQVRGHGLSCEFQVPASMPGKPLDFGKVNVEFTPRAGDDGEIIPYLDDSTDCDEDGGWYYEVEPGTTKPRSIHACASTCTRLMGSVTGNVDIQVGCETIRRDPVK